MVCVCANSLYSAAPVECPLGFPPVIDFPPCHGFDVVHGAHAPRERVYACFTVGPSATHLAQGETR